ncbi:MAG: DUF58 domain-containing protein, partial [Planctomycetota bacterium]
SLLAIGAAWPWVGMRGLRCELYFNMEQSEEQRSTKATLKVTNRWPIPVFGVMLEGSFLQDVFTEDDIVLVALKRLPGWSVSEFTWEFKPQRRGVLPRENPSLSTAFPFGIQKCDKPVEVENQLIVWPKCEELNSLPMLEGKQFNIDGKLSDRPGQDGDVIGARHYRRGDSLKHVNWSLTARMNRLVVLERQTAAQQPIRIVLDLCPQNHKGQGGQSSFEWSIRIAASMSRKFHQHQSFVQLECLGMPRDEANVITNQKGLNRLLDYLACLPDLESQRQSQMQGDIQVDQVAIPAGAGALEKVYWIHALTESENFGIKGVTEIRLNPDSLEIQSSTDALGNNPREQFANKRIFIGDLSLTNSEFQNGWERLCSDG